VLNPTFSHPNGKSIGHGHLPLCVVSSSYLLFSNFDFLTPPPVTIYSSLSYTFSAPPSNFILQACHDARLERIPKQIGAQRNQFMKLTPDSVRGYQTLSNANAKDSKLGAKVRELISLAVPITTHCDGCITIHTDKALKAGATREEIAEALGVAMAINAGAALVYSLRTLDAVDAHSAAK
jgi:AhpD family alkylhydroperoxidase